MEILKGLITSRADPDKLSHTKLWSNIGMAAMTANFIYMGVYNNLTEWYAWIYATVVVAPSLASKLIALRWGTNYTQENNNSKTGDGE